MTSLKRNFIDARRGLSDLPLRGIKDRLERHLTYRSATCPIELRFIVNHE